MRPHSLALPLLLVLGGCAGQRAHVPATAAMEQAPLPDTPAQARAEIARLEREIQRSRQGLGLPAELSAPAPAMDGAPAEAVSEAEADESPAPESAPLSRSEGRQSDSRGACSQPCKLARAICRAAGRICNIADYLGDETARDKCARAKVDCMEARGKAGRCPDCR